MILITGFSFGNLEIPDETAKLKMRVNFMELRDISKRFTDPFNEHFTIYQRSIAGIRISVGEALFITYECMNAAIYKEEKITQGKSEEIIEKAQRLSSVYSNRAKMREIIYG